MPRISIITVCYNAGKTIEPTIQSVINQTFLNFEYIIIDGASTDNTLNIINKYKDNITHIISEPDKGIYDAMNKGLQQARGEYVIFMNAGDTFHSCETLEKIFQKCLNADVIYGDTLLTDSNFNITGKRRLRPPKHLQYKHFSKGMLVSHQAFIAKRKIAHFFDLNYKYSADFDWTLKILKKARNICNTQLVVAHFMKGGQTSKTIIPGLKERFKIMTKHYGWLRTLFSHFYIFVRFIMQKI